MLKWRLCHLNHIVACYVLIYLFLSVTSLQSTRHGATSPDGNDLNAEFEFTSRNSNHIAFQDSNLYEGNDPYVEYSHQWAVQILGGPTKADEIANKHDFLNVGQIFPDVYHFVHKRIAKRSTSKNDHYHGRLSSEPEVVWHEQQIVKKRSKRDLISLDRRPQGKAKRNRNKKRATNAFPLTDPKWRLMWYLNRGNGRDMNVVDAWKQGITGKGVVVTILDDGLEKDHPDIIRNYDPMASVDVNNSDPDPMPTYDMADSNRHGTRCAGEVAAEANNTVCAIGVAYEAGVGGVRMLDGDVTDAVEARSLSHNPQHIDIYSASWGPDDDGKTVDGPGELAKRAFTEGISKGRNGKGSIFVWASGNGGRDHDNCNCDGYTNSIWTLSISSATENGLVPWYSEACSSTLATTYSSGGTGEDQIVTIDLHHACTESHTGTSASAPLAAGICALALQANMNLTWRDMQHIVVRTARPENLVSPDWATNGVGRNVSHSFGYGLMDAGAMVRLAKRWTNVPDQHKCEVKAPYIDKKIPAKSKVTLSLSVPDCPGVNFLEHVQAKVTLISGRRGELQIYLISPLGTRSTLLAHRRKDMNRAGFTDWPFMTVHCWGESPIGKWTLEIHNEGKYSGRTILRRWSLVMYGTEEEVNDGRAVNLSNNRNHNKHSGGARKKDPMKFFVFKNGGKNLDKLDFGMYVGKNKLSSDKSSIDREGNKKDWRNKGKESMKGNNNRKEPRQNHSKFPSFNHSFESLREPTMLVEEKKLDVDKRQEGGLKSKFFNGTDIIGGENLLVPGPFGFGGAGEQQQVTTPPSSSIAASSSRSSSSAPTSSLSSLSSSVQLSSISPITFSSSSNLSYRNSTAGLKFSIAPAESYINELNGRKGWTASFPTIPSATHDNQSESHKGRMKSWSLNLHGIEKDPNNEGLYGQTVLIEKDRKPTRAEEFDGSDNSVHVEPSNEHIPPLAANAELGKPSVSIISTSYTPSEGSRCAKMSSSGQCLDCGAELYYLNGTCVKSCGLGHFVQTFAENEGRSKALICLKCHFTCQTCSGPHEYDCESCSEDAVLDPTGTEAGVHERRCLLVIRLSKVTESEEKGETIFPVLAYYIVTTILASFLIFSICCAALYCRNLFSSGDSSFRSQNMVYAPVSRDENMYDETAEDYFEEISRDKLLLKDQKSHPSLSNVDYGSDKSAISNETFPKLPLTTLATFRSSTEDLDSSDFTQSNAGLCNADFSEQDYVSYLTKLGNDKSHNFQSKHCML